MGPVITYELRTGLSSFLEEVVHLEDLKNVCLLEANQVEELGFEM